jgi:hypothetical protein
VTVGWKLVKQFLNNEVSFVQAEEEFNRLFGSDFNNEIWQKIRQINDLDPDELHAQQQSLALELDMQIEMSIDAQQVAPTKDTADDDRVASDDSDFDMDFDDNEETRFLLFRLRCFVSWILIDDTTGS